MICLHFEPEFESWRRQASSCLRRKIPPHNLVWNAAGGDRENSLFDTDGRQDIYRDNPGTVVIPRRFVELAKCVSFHRDVDKWGLLYRVAWRLIHGEPNLLQITVDPDVYRLLQLEKSVRRDAHKMKAFVRFRRELGAEYVAWYRPDNDIVRYVAPFFARRFAAMSWSILTPDASVHWDKHRLAYGPGVAQDPFAGTDPLEALWRTYYSSIFNPARLKIKTMKREMPTRFWATLPEARDIPLLIQAAEHRTSGFLQNQTLSAEPFVPKPESLQHLAEASAGCRGCALYHHATQTVFGEGNARAGVVLVGEQPGDEEDRQGRPFVGPAGRVLDQALDELEWPRESLYLTNSVKHFKHTAHGPRRLHKKPSPREITACRPWLEAEIKQIQPSVLVCLGNSAAYSAFGKICRVSEERGRVQRSAWCEATIVTFHPSAILRAPDRSARDEIYRSLVADLALAKKKFTELQKVS